jgi:hypothetical protein
MLSRLVVVSIVFMFLACGSSAANHPATPPASEHPAAPSDNSPAITLRIQRALPLFDAPIPVPSGWTMELRRGDAAVLRPEAGGSQSFTVSFSNPAASDPSLGICQGSIATDRVGPVTLAGHPGSYEYYCPPVEGTLGRWTVALPTADGSAWRWDYLGATGLESGPDADAFVAVLEAFTAPNPTRKPTPSPAG